MISTYDTIGVVGGLIVASAWVPQAYRVLKRRSAGDISYAMQVGWVLGLGVTDAPSTAVCLVSYVCSLQVGLQRCQRYLGFLSLSVPRPEQPQQSSSSRLGAGQLVRQEQQQQ